MKADYNYFMSGEFTADDHFFPAYVLGESSNPDYETYVAQRSYGKYKNHTQWLKNVIGQYIKYHQENSREDLVFGHNGGDISTHFETEVDLPWHKYLDRENYKAIGYKGSSADGITLYHMDDEKKRRQKLQKAAGE